MQRMLGVQDVALAASASILAFATGVLAQQSIDEIRNSYNFLQAGLSTLAAGSSVALCLARGRLDSEMAMADFFSTTRFTKQNDYGAIISFVGNNGTIIGVNVSKPNANTVKWIGHNTWAQGNCTALVPLWAAPPQAPLAQSPTAQAGPSCTCWHVPSITAHSSTRGGVAALHNVERVDPQCFRVPSYQCEVHGKTRMPDLHQYVVATAGQNLGTMPIKLKGPSELFQMMLEAEQDRVECTYFFGIENLGARTLARMVAESLATLDASEKGRTSDLVDWSLGRLNLSEKPDVKWKGAAATVLLVSLLELVLMILLTCVFGLDPFVSSLGARRGVRSLRLGAGGVTNFGDLWLLEVKGYKIDEWETPVLKVIPRRDLKLWYADAAMKIIGLATILSFWATAVLGYVSPVGLHRSEAWGNTGRWAIIVAGVGTVIGFITSTLPLRLLGVSFPGRRRERGYGMVGYCALECMVELTLTMVRLTPGWRRNKWLLRCWYLTLEAGVWLQWFAGKRCIATGPHSESHGVPWELTAIQAGALARAMVLSAVSGSWTNNS